MVTNAVHTPEDVKRCIAERAELAVRGHASLLRRRQLFRRTAMLASLVCSTFQYYFFTIGLEILSMPSLTVFLAAARLG